MTEPTDKRTSEQIAAYARLEEVGKILFGETRWQLPLANALGIAQSQVNRFAKGLRTISPEVEAKLADLCNVQKRKLAKDARRLMVVELTIRDIQKTQEGPGLWDEPGEDDETTEPPYGL